MRVFALHFVVEDKLPKLPKLAKLGRNAFLGFLRTKPHLYRARPDPLYPPPRFVLGADHPTLESNVLAMPLARRGRLVVALIVLPAAVMLSCVLCVSLLAVLSVDQAMVYSGGVVANRGAFGRIGGSF